MAVALILRPPEPFPRGQNHVPNWAAAVPLEGPEGPPGKAPYQEPLPAPRRRGKQRNSSALSFLLLAVVAVTARTFRDSEPRRLLTRDAALLSALGLPCVLHRTTIGRRIADLIPEAEAQISALGEQIAQEAAPPPGHSQVSAIDGRMCEARSPRRHKADRPEGCVPAALRGVDTESSWSKSGYRNWV